MAADDSVLHKAGVARERLQMLERWQHRVVAEELLPNTHLIMWRNGQWCYNASTGIRSADGTPIGSDTIFHIMSMTKPVASVALMMLYEEGAFLLGDPLFKFLGDGWKKENMKVYKSGDYKNGYETDPCQKNVTMKHVLTHTSGICHGFDHKGVENKVDQIYHEGGFNRWQHPDLATFANKLPGAPLLFQPGTAYKYGFNTDICARLVEVLSGMPFEEFLQKRLFDPLGMVDTGFYVPEDKRSRCVGMWMSRGGKTNLGIKNNPAEATKSRRGLQDMTRHNPVPWGEQVRYMLGGCGGLVSTAMDYGRFLEMLMLGGRSPSGHRLLSAKTVEWMTTNHLEKDGVPCDMSDIAAPGYTETTSAQGSGFGLGFEVSTMPVKSRQIASAGSFRWGGAASTSFLCDPDENMFWVMMSALRFRNDFVFPMTPLVKQLTYACIDDDAEERRWARRSKSAL